MWFIWKNVSLLLFQRDLLRNMTSLLFMLMLLAFSSHIGALPTSTKSQQSVGLQNHFLKTKYIFKESGLTKRSAIEVEDLYRTNKSVVRTRHEKPSQKVVKILRQYVRVWCHFQILLFFELVVIVVEKCDILFYNFFIKW